MSEQSLILGGGMTGLAAGIASGFPVCEATDRPGGICSSYYMAAGASEPLAQGADHSQAYRFEIGGGHWIFGGDPLVLRFISSLVDVTRFERRSAVYFPVGASYVPYPLQNNLRYLDQATAARALAEMALPKPPVQTMADWLSVHFGATLNELFFEPFHKLYTGGLYREIAPQDSYKSPVDLAAALAGALQEAPPVGYNTTFIYPADGLNALSSRMAQRCEVRYGKQAVEIDLAARRVRFADGSSAAYAQLISTLPLPQALQMAGITTASTADPHSSVLVLNIGASKGPRCPDAHWLYIPSSSAGFHRVGFYSNVDAGFLPAAARDARDKVSIYVEKAYTETPSSDAVAAYGESVVRELQAWGFIGAAEVVHPTWIEYAYTWSRPGSSWVKEGLAALEAHGVYQIGRYGRWIFQGIADSIRDGFIAGSSLR